MKQSTIKNYSGTRGINSKSLGQTRICDCTVAIVTRAFKINVFVSVD